MGEVPLARAAGIHRTDVDADKRRPEGLSLYPVASAAFGLVLAFFADRTADCGAEIGVHGRIWCVQVT